MAVTIVGPGATLETSSGNMPVEIKLDQIEVFGRLKMTRAQIAQWYGITEAQVATLFRKPEVRIAYDKGRAETVVAVKQKQLQVALNGNVTMLMHTGRRTLARGRFIGSISRIKIWKSIL